MNKNKNIISQIENFNDLKKLIQNSNIRHDINLIEKAYLFAENLHKNQKRLSGEDYVKHLLRVAGLITNLNLDSISIACALLHDSLEEGNITLEKIDKEFGTEIAFIINGLTNVKHLIQNYEEDSTIIQNTRDLILNSTEDIRILIIRLAEKLDNVYSLNALPSNIAINSSKKILNIYAPLCEYLGLGFFKRELEDNAFKILNPKEYQITVDSLNKIVGEQLDIIEEFKIELEKTIKKGNISAISIQTRIKGIYSAYKKAKRKFTNAGEEVSYKSFERLHDILAARIILNSIEECYIALGIIHSNWEHIPNEFDDYIAKPKPNGYRSIQTVIKYKNYKFEVQIRTQEMHEYNEFGPASHIAYKLMGDSVNIGNTLTWTKDLVKWQNSKELNKDIYKIKAFANSVFVFTPMGLLIRLPKGSTPIDFAFRIHLEIALRFNGAKVNGKIVPKEYELKTGDTVEILTGHQITVSNDWLKLAKSQSARQKIRRYLKILKLKQENNSNK